MGALMGRAMPETGLERMEVCGQRATETLVIHAFQ